VALRTAEIFVGSLAVEPSLPQRVQIKLVFMVRRFKRALEELPPCHSPEGFERRQKRLMKRLEYREVHGYVSRDDPFTIREYLDRRPRVGLLQSLLNNLEKLGHHLVEDLALRLFWHWAVLWFKQPFKLHQAKIDMSHCLAFARFASGHVPSSDCSRRPNQRRCALAKALSPFGSSTGSLMKVTGVWRGI
jgi:hypothetical protein